MKSNPDYYQIPVADRQALLDEEAEDELRAKAEDEAEPTSSPDEDNGDGDEVDSETEEEDAGDGVEAKADPAPKRSKRRSRRKTAVSKQTMAKKMSRIVKQAITMQMTIIAMMRTAKTTRRPWLQLLKQIRFQNLLQTKTLLMTNRNQMTQMKLKQVKNL